MAAYQHYYWFSQYYASHETPRKTGEEKTTTTTTTTNKRQTSRCLQSNIHRRRYTRTLLAERTGPRRQAVHQDTNTSHDTITRSSPGLLGRSNLRDSLTHSRWIQVHQGKWSLLIRKNVFAVEQGLYYRSLVIIARSTLIDITHLTGCYKRCGSLDRGGGGEGGLTYIGNTCRCRNDNSPFAAGGCRFPFAYPICSYLADSSRSVDPVFVPHSDFCCLAPTPLTLAAVHHRIVGQEEAKTAQNSKFRLEIFGVLGNSIGRIHLTCLWNILN